MKTLTTTRKQFLHDVFVTAMEGSIGYWSQAKSYHWYHRGGEPDLDGFNAVITEDSEAEGVFVRREINASVIADGINRIATDDSVSIRKDIRNSIQSASLDNDACDIDAECADCIVQIGLFGKLIFG